MHSRAFLRKFKPYEWELSNEQIAARFGLKKESILRFDTNTSPFVPEELLDDLVRVIHELPLNQYPDASYAALRQQVSRYSNLKPEQVIITNGADEGLDIIWKAYLDPKSHAIISSPTYSLYQDVIKIYGGQYQNVPRVKEFEDNVDGILRNVTAATKIIFLCSPNNPTGNTTRRDTIEHLLSKADATIVIDEAYYEFSGTTVADLTHKFDNIIVVRTLSKAFSLAGARVGYILASKKTARDLNKVRPPNSVGVISLKLAEIAMNDTTKMNSLVRIMIKERERCFKEISSMRATKVYPSQTNFLLVKLLDRDPSQVHRFLMSRGLVVRDVSSISGLRGCLRIGMGTPEQNDILLKVLGEL